MLVLKDQTAKPPRPLLRGVSWEQSSGTHTVPSCGGIYCGIKNAQRARPGAFPSPLRAGGHSEITESRTERCTSTRVSRAFS